MKPDELEPVIKEVEKELAEMFELVVEARDQCNAWLRHNEFKMRLTKMMIESYDRK